MKSALIFGISGQDGSYLAKLLLDKGYRVYGTSRDAEMSHFYNLDRLGIQDSITKISVSTLDFNSVYRCILDTEPDEIYNLSGLSSVGLSFGQPVQALESISLATLYLLESIRLTGKSIKFYNAGSSECFGNSFVPANEETPFHPISPYGVAKSAAFWQVSNYRSAYDLFACTGILFNHESPLRPDRFVIKKIVMKAKEIAEGRSDNLTLGNLSVIRDWGWAPDYVEAIWSMMQNTEPTDYVISSGESHSLKTFVQSIFASLNLDWEKHVQIDQCLERPLEIQVSRGNPAKVRSELNWESKHTLPQISRKMIADQLY